MWVTLTSCPFLFSKENFQLIGEMYELTTVIIIGVELNYFDNFSGNLCSYTTRYI